ncbi:Fructose-6-phosphate aldolase 1 [Mycobacteroides abscessus subsp. abscessus]|nr:Fructose-6-phosphate aldolase 1 [Mycobacteroides abscessus subsp. abscessus]
MELMLDSANLKNIRYYTEVFPLVGITSNPSILKKEGKLELINHFKEIQNIIGNERSLHIQVTTDKSEKIVEEAYKIIEKLGKDVYIKIPVNEEGLKAIKKLKNENFNITATAIYTMAQGDYAIMAGVDYIAPYFNRMENTNIDPERGISHYAKMIQSGNFQTKILAASFKNIGQVMRAFESGAHCATVDPALLSTSLNMPSIEMAVADFKKDWEDVYGKDKTFLDI